MQSGNNYDQIMISPKSLQDNHEEKFFTRALSKEANSAGNSSFRVYYGGATGAIPFRWETRPGTPKHAFSESSIPPLTPPPSYYSSSSHSNSKASSKSTLLSSIFPRLTPRKSRTPTSSSFSSGSSSSSASWSSSHSSSFSPSSPFVRPKFFKRRRRFSESSPSLPYGYSFDDNEGDAKVESSNSPTSTLCFGGCSSRASVFRGCYQLGNVKNALLSIVGHRSTSRGTLKS